MDDGYIEEEQLPDCCREFYCTDIELTPFVSFVCPTCGTEWDIDRYVSFTEEG